MTTATQTAHEAAAPSPRIAADPAEIDRTIGLFLEPGDTIEVRIPAKAARHGGTIAGYFDDPAAMRKAVIQASRDGHEAIYCTLNPCDPTVAARGRNHLQRLKNTTHDKEILRRRRLLIDCDPIRPAGISATEVEHQIAIERARDVTRVLGEECGWPAPALADSGNGAHLLYWIDLPNDSDSDDLVRRVLQGMSERFSDDHVKIDATVDNAARITKFYGTPVRKGESTAARPHRVSRFIALPETRVALTRRQLEDLAARREPVRPRMTERSSRREWSVESWILEQRLEVRDPEPYNGGRKWVLEACPFNRDHTAPDAAIFEDATGRLGFTCLHDSCSGYGWREFRECIEGPRARRPNGAAESPAPPRAQPECIPMGRLLTMAVPRPEMLIEGFLPLRGASLLVGTPKSGKTILAVQTALSVASGEALFDYYRVLKPGPVLILEQDDPGATGSIKDIVERSKRTRSDLPFYLVPRVPFNFGAEFLDWLEGQIRRLSLRLCILDSYTALRASRTGGGDIVKAEQEDLTQLDSLGKRTNSTIQILHHNSKGSASLDWSQQAAGSYAMAAATEAQIFLSRFFDLETGAPERLARVRGRHGHDVECVLKFCTATLDYEHVLEGGASPLYPMLLQLEQMFGDQVFTPKELQDKGVMPRTTVHRTLNSLMRAGVLRKLKYGEYQTCRPGRAV